jgi:hypothetical protein
VKDYICIQLFTNKFSFDQDHSEEILKYLSLDACVGFQLCMLSLAPIYIGPDSLDLEDIEVTPMGYGAVMESED